jgi:hypothetical protein
MLLAVGLLAGVGVWSALARPPAPQIRTALVLAALASASELLGSLVLALQALALGYAAARVLYASHAEVRDHPRVGQALASLAPLRSSLGVHGGPLASALRYVDELTPCPGASAG